MTSPTSAVVPCPSCGARNRLPSAAAGVPRCAKCHRFLPWSIDATDHDFDEVVSSATVPVVVDCWAAWCGPCRAVAPVLARAAVSHAGHLKLVKLDTEAAPGTAARLGIRSIPALLLYRDGQLVDRRVGALGDAALEQWLSSHGVGQVSS